MSARLGELSDWRTEGKARGIELSLSEIRDGEEAVLKRAYHYGKSVGHPSKMLQCSMRVETDDRTGKTVSRHIQDFAGSDMVYTCPPGYIAQLMANDEALGPFDAKAIDREPNKASVEKLMKLPSFRQAYEFDGMRPDQFAHFGSFKATEAEFAAATRQTVDFVRITLESLGFPAATLCDKAGVVRPRRACYPLDRSREDGTEGKARHEANHPQRSPDYRGAERRADRSAKPASAGAGQRPAGRERPAAPSPDGARSAGAAEVVHSADRRGDEVHALRLLEGQAGRAGAARRCAARLWRGFELHRPRQTDR
jgi:hypothetical protein